MFDSFGISFYRTPIFFYDGNFLQLLESYVDVFVESFQLFNAFLFTFCFYYC